VPYVPTFGVKVKVVAHEVHLGTPAVNAHVIQFALTGQAVHTLSPLLY